MYGVPVGKHHESAGADETLFSDPAVSRWRTASIIGAVVLSIYALIVTSFAFATSNFTELPFVFCLLVVVGLIGYASQRKWPIKFRTRYHVLIGAIVLQSLVAILMLVVSAVNGASYECDPNDTEAQCASSKKLAGIAVALVCLGIIACCTLCCACPFFYVRALRTASSRQRFGFELDDAFDEESSESASGYNSDDREVSIDKFRL